MRRMILWVDFRLGKLLVYLVRSNPRPLQEGALRGKDSQLSSEYPADLTELSILGL